MNPTLPADLRSKKTRVWPVRLLYLGMGLLVGSISFDRFSGHSPHHLVWGWIAAVSATFFFLMALTFGRGLDGSLPPNK